MSLWNVSFGFIPNIKTDQLKTRCTWIVGLFHRYFLDISFEWRRILLKTDMLKTRPRSFLVGFFHRSLLCLFIGLFYRSPFNVSFKCTRILLKTDMLKTRPRWYSADLLCVYINLFNRFLA